MNENEDNGSSGVNEAIAALCGLSAEAIEAEIDLCESRLRTLRALRSTLRPAKAVKVRKAKKEKAGAA